MVHSFAKAAAYADHLAAAEQTLAGAAPLTELDPELTVEQAYLVQLETIGRRVAGGAKIVGKKIGLTSLAMQKLLGVDQPDYGHLLDDMAVENNGDIPAGRLLQPKVEAEIAFVLKKDLAGPNVTAADVLLATQYVLPALEIVDSRIADWKIKLQDTVADNASSGLFVLGGKPVRVDEVDLPRLGMALYKNGSLVNTGVGAAALGNPAYCAAWLANKLHEFGITLKAGEVILSGALSAAVNAEPGDTFSARIACLGQVGVSFR
ncbi:2-keto-4-pentenoate hydratase [Paenibacillus naphthalenovorans]|uniref:2-keto-4-pentenoate hydratase n=1 Tax=Paenibacillus naphthalenovorans TaxID=162209 RepID=A0A0U2N233_9BACL|nr:fumarylacetoacetate hydrolase family protein [Paenibacillus naphthalenovorans]ALS25119.1 2-keto-4-pentenoate hydratase [Paenibacillus naphthalenovorans]GCL73227.1 2-keto-4-pentenoate hydratase [Paenibacillus naphthalenovorans]SDI35288.1 2-keto-4-pentenoate hydratase [Paenibacillus naphthalenovorans]